MRALVFVGLAACSFAPARSGGGDDITNPGDDAPPTPSDGVVDSLVDVATDAPFDPATQCPPEYDIVIAGLTSRYRAILTFADWPAQHADCANDLPGKTHLVVYDDATELNLVGSQPTPRFLVGHFQMANQQAVDANWFGVTGEPVDITFWLGGQPNDDGGGEDGSQDRAFINYNTGTGVQDGPASFAAEALCECDGKQIPPQIAALL